VCETRFILDISWKFVSILGIYSEKIPIEKYHTNIAKILKVVKIFLFKFYNFIVNFMNSQISNIRSYTYLCFKNVFHDRWWSVWTAETRSVVEQHNKVLLCVDGSQYCNIEPLKNSDQHELDLNIESVPRSKHSPSWL
jgi:hypothetical protein